MINYIKGYFAMISELISAVAIVTIMTAVKVVEDEQNEVEMNVKKTKTTTTK